MSKMELALPGRIDGHTRDDFVQKSIFVRLPDILQDLLERNKGKFGFQVEVKIALLEKELRDGSHSFALIDGSDGGPSWVEFDPQVAAKPFRNVSWFFLENYAYRLVLHHINYFQGDRQDPFRSHKDEAIEKALNSMGEYISHPFSRDGFHQVCLGSLWGNQVDLSFSSGKFSEEDATQNLLIDDAKECWDSLSLKGDILVILDNCGAELFNDLLFVDFFLSSPKFSGSLHLHCKSHPVFVSDAIYSDVLHHIYKMTKLKGFEEVGKLLTASLENSRLKIKANNFYNSPLPFWDAPENLKQEFVQGELVVTKGDANYRRLLDDRLWPAWTPFRTALRYWSWSSLLALRTCKSPAIVGISRKQQLNFSSSADKDWQVNGKTGIMSWKA